MIRRNLYVASKAAPEHRQPCTCDLWPFPHRKEAACDDNGWREDWARECAIDFKQFQKENKE